jgi:hypothetical protein
MFHHSTLPPSRSRLRPVPRHRPRRALARLAPLLCAATTACCALLCAGSAGADASASDATRALQLNDTGSELYAAGNYAAALQTFERAYALVAEPNLLFNIAGCHERLGERSQAIEYYRWFLSSPGVNTEGRRRAIAALGRLTDQPPPAAPPQQPEASSDSPVWPLATLGAGILFAGLGAGLYLDGAHDHKEVTSSPGFGDGTASSSLTEVRAHELVDSGDTKKVIGAIGLGLGGALIATHVVITVWHASQHEAGAPSAELRLVPGGWSVAGKF